jgi:hypothetical protein
MDPDGSRKINQLGRSLVLAPRVRETSKNLINQTKRVNHARTLTG